LKPKRSTDSGRAETWEAALTAAAAGDGPAALEACWAWWDRTGGPGLAEKDDVSLREVASRLTVWDQIALWVGEIDRRPHNSRSWKMLGYAFMRGGLYIPNLFSAAEQAFLVSEAHTEDEPARVILLEKIELCREARAGNISVRAELAAAEEAFAVPFGAFPEEIVLPEAFVQMGVCPGRTLKVTPAVIAPDVLDGLGA